MSQLSETFWITFTTMGFAFLSGMVAYLFKSKCSHVKCLGCFELERDIEAELEDTLVSPESVIEPPLSMQPAGRPTTRRDSMDSKIARKPRTRRFKLPPSEEEPTAVVTEAPKETAAAELKGSTRKFAKGSQEAKDFMDMLRKKRKGKL